MSKKNKSLIALLLVLCVGLVGITIAYFSNSTEIENEFNTKEYGTTYTEEFTSPSNWLPGDTTDKTVIVTNSGLVDEAVRISLTEKWVAKDGTILSGLIDSNGNLTDNTENSEHAAIINFSDNGDFTYSNGYYYYNYRLAPNETTSSLIDSVTFNSKVKNSDDCFTNENNGVKTITCNTTESGYDGATYTLTFNIETIQYNKYKEAWGVDIANSSMKPITAREFISKANPVSVTNYTDGDIHEMYTFEHEATEQTPAQTEYRYIGDNPNNYVYFNCDSLDIQNSNTCEVWRIIGTFDVERTDPTDSSNTITETRMKLVRGSDFETTMQWDNRNSERYSSGNYGKNDWNGSVMNTYLNGDYYNSLSATAQSQIDNAIYYLGGREYNSTTQYGSTEDIYTWERGTTVYNDTRPTSWEGKVALMYPSDQYMTYAKGVDDNCYNNPNQCASWGWPGGDPTKGWIHNTNKLEGSTGQQRTWFLSPDSGDSGNVLVAVDDGYLSGGGGILSDCESLFCGCCGYNCNLISY